jgi:UDP-N-acetylmuramate dehydrogenase
VPAVREQVLLAGHTTLRLGGPAARFAEAASEDEIVATVRAADQAGDPLLVLGGGSNLVISDEGFAGTVIRLASTGIGVRGADDGGVLVEVQAGEIWDRLVEWSVTEKLSGMECLAGIPGLVGATPIQNVGAYGQEVATVIATVRVYDRATSAVVTLTGADCGFGYRTSVFKQAQARRQPHGPAPASDQPAAGPPIIEPTGRYVVLAVTFRLERSPMAAPVRYAELAARLGVCMADRAPLAEVRDAVLELRRGKGMVLDPGDPDTVSAGSFFTNPVLDAGQFARLEQVVAARLGWTGGVPHFTAGDGLVKVPAAWLIERAGFGKGHPPGGAARISSKHTLALTNAGGATSAELIELARQITSGVHAAFGVRLANEPVLVGLTL